MTEFTDLTFFRYTPSPWAFASGFPYVLLNIGWLGSRVPTPHRAISEEEKDSILYHLGEFMKHPVNLCRGSHDCGICGFHPYDPPDRGEQGGNGEIFVPGVNNIVYVAPTLIHHYIKHDGYVPPEEFIEAVRNAGSMDSYRRFYDLHEASGRPYGPQSLQQRLHHMPMHVGQAIITSAEAVGEPLMVQP